VHERWVQNCGTDISVFCVIVMRDTYLSVRNSRGSRSSRCLIYSNFF